MLTAFYYCSSVSGLKYCWVAKGESVLFCCIQTLFCMGFFLF